MIMCDIMERWGAFGEERHKTVDKWEVFSILDGRGIRFREFCALSARGGGRRTAEV